MVRIIRWAHLFSKGALSASERREVRYPIGPLDFLERGDLSTVSSSPPSPLPPTSASSARSLTLTSSRLIWLWSLFRFQSQHPQPCPMASSRLIRMRLFWALRWVVQLIYWIPGKNVNRNWQNLEDLDISHWFRFRPVFHGLNSLVFFLNSLEINYLGALSHKSHCSWPATVMEGELSWA